MQSTFYTVRIIARKPWLPDEKAKEYDVCFDAEFGWYVYENPEDTLLENINLCRSIEDAMLDASQIRDHDFDGMTVESVIIETHTVSTTSQVV